MARVADTMNSAGVAVFRTGDFLNAEIMYEAAIMNYMNQSSDNDESLQNHIALAKKNLSLVENIVNIDFDAEQCIMNYHVPNGKINQTGTIECKKKTIKSTPNLELLNASYLKLKIK